MNRRSILLTASILLTGNGALAFSPATPNNLSSSRQCAQSSTSMMMASDSRRTFLTDITKVAASTMLVGGITTSTSANALDFDAFEKGEIANDTAKCDPKKDPKCIPKLSEDEALCQYGGGGTARGEACMRVRKAGGKLPEVKKERSLGGAYAM